jgi:hypothetical protein
MKSGVNGLGQSLYSQWFISKCQGRHEIRSERTGTSFFRVRQHNENVEGEIRHDPRRKRKHLKKYPKKINPIFCPFRQVVRSTGRNIAKAFKVHVQEAQIPLYIQLMFFCNVCQVMPPGKIWLNLKTHLCSRCVPQDGGENWPPFSLQPPSALMMSYVVSMIVKWVVM